ncbi:MAG: T9SS type A sorting domain-containing protein [Bacteroidetes bacterium]|nr:T9SS type A sorting domain-containing protein [Bacteroidota bacterium]
MKKNLLILSTAILAGGIILFSTHSNGRANLAGAPGYTTGSPGDGANCTDCHAGTAVSGGTITSNIPVTGYVPGSTYSFSASISGSSTNNYGFEVGCEDLLGNVLGTLSAPGTGAKLVSGSKFVTHSSAPTGTSKTWTFSWTAPTSSTITSVTFYGAFNVGNNDGTQNNDVTKNTSVTYSISTEGIQEQQAKTAVSIFPNPVVNSLHLSSSEELAKAYIYTSDGKLVKEISAGELSSKVIDVVSLPNGHYFLIVKGAHSAASATAFIKE